MIFLLKIKNFPIQKMFREIFKFKNIFNYPAIALEITIF